MTRKRARAGLHFGVGLGCVLSKSKGEGRYRRREVCDEGWSFPNNCTKVIREGRPNQDNVDWRMLLAVHPPRFGRISSSRFEKSTPKHPARLSSARLTCARVTKNEAGPQGGGVWLVSVRAPAPNHGSSQNLYQGISRIPTLG